mmetsp:Transcript_98694/g.313141  ORF Transcript_98694/g.313141 Transcript_98694/m.313141 type:complete len:234 (-) Transcript_98694:391-1092(-)
MRSSARLIDIVGQWPQQAAAARRTDAPGAIVVATGPTPSHDHATSSARSVAMPICRSCGHIATCAALAARSAPKPASASARPASPPAPPPRRPRSRARAALKTSGNCSCSDPPGRLAQAARSLNGAASSKRCSPGLARRSVYAKAMASPSHPGTTPNGAASAAAASAARAAVRASVLALASQRPIRGTCSAGTVCKRAQRSTQLRSTVATSTSAVPCKASNSRKTPSRSACPM